MKIMNHEQYAKEGDPAFPASDGGTSWLGMSLRDWFAGQAMQALVREYFEANGRCMGTDHPYNNIPHHAYRMADAMLKARSEVR